MYTQLKNQVLPSLKSFTDDLLIHDKKALSRFKGGFIHASRTSGTNLVRFRLSDYSYSKGKNSIFKQLETDRAFLLGKHNSIFWFYDGKEFLKQINRAEATQWLEKFHAKVLERFYMLERLNIDSIAHELHLLMQTHKNWKKVLIEEYFNGTNPESSLRRLRNHFNYNKIRRCSLDDLKATLYDNLAFSTDDIGADAL